jgi:hypothetical protein
MCCLTWINAKLTKLNKLEWLLWIAVFGVYFVRLRGRYRSGTMTGRAGICRGWPDFYEFVRAPTRNKRRN